MCWLHLKNHRGKREMTVVFPYYSFIIYRVFLKYFHINILNWYKNVNSPLEGKEWPEIIVQSEPLKIRNFLTSPVSVFNFISTIHIKICSILFWFHFEDDIVNYLSESLFLKNLSESLFLKKTTNLYLVSSRTSQGTPGVHPACLRRMACWRKKPTRGAWWVSPKRVWPDWFNEDLVQSSVCRERNKKKEKEKSNEKDDKYIIQ